MEPASRVLLIDADNRNGGWATLADALTGGGAFAVRVRPEIVAADFDHNTARGDTRQFVDYCRAHHLVPVVCASGGVDRFHVFVRVADGPTRKLLVKEARRLHADVRSGNNRVRPPLSPHRAGGRSELLDPLDPLNAIDALLGPLDGLAPRFHRLLRFGDMDGEYKSPSEMVQAITTGAVHAGWAEHELLEVLLDPANVGGWRVRERDQRERRRAEGYVRTCWKNAVRFVARASLAHFQATVDAADWSGQQGAVNKAVMQAYLDIAKRANTLTPDASQRRLADHAGVHAKTVERAQPRLVAADWIAVDRPGYRREATRWRFGPRCAGVGTYAIPVLGGRGVYADTYALAHDVWRFQGLGKHVQQTYTALQDGPATIGELVERTHYQRRTISRHLERLRDHGLVTRAENGRYHVVEHFDFDALAVELGVAGTGERQRTRHRQQGALHAEYLEHDRFSFERWQELSAHEKWRRIQRYNRRRALLLVQLNVEPAPHLATLGTITALTRAR
jgi:DNA-binding transcriptional ArsR family regulator